MNITITVRTDDTAFYPGSENALTIQRAVENALVHMTVSRCDHAVYHYGDAENVTDSHVKAEVNR